MMSGVYHMFSLRGRSIDQFSLYNKKTGARNGRVRAAVPCRLQLRIGIGYHV
jgi:hypothetical protein